MRFDRNDSSFAILMLVRTHTRMCVRACVRACSRGETDNYVGGRNAAPGTGANQADADRRVPFLSILASLSERQTDRQTEIERGEGWEKRREDQLGYPGSPGRPPSPPSRFAMETFHSTGYPRASRTRTCTRTRMRARVRPAVTLGRFASELTQRARIGYCCIRSSAAPVSLGRLHVSHGEAAGVELYLDEY